MYNDPKLLALDFDQYQRYRTATEMLHSIPGLLEAPDGSFVPFRLLEVGSNIINLFPDFLKESGLTRVVRCDVIASEKPDPDYVQLELGKPLPFEDNSFEVVAALEVLEHMPASERPIFIQECLRVAKRCVILSSPRGDVDVEFAEATLKALLMRHFGMTLPFLDEHKQFCLPRPEEIKSVMESLQLPWQAVQNSSLDRWLGISWFSNYCVGSLGKDTDEGKFWLSRFNHSYNAIEYEKAPGGPCYRLFWTIIKDPGLFDLLPSGFRENQFAIARPATTEKVQEDALFSFGGVFGRYVHGILGLLIRETTELRTVVATLEQTESRLRSDIIRHEQSEAELLANIAAHHKAEIELRAIITALQKSESELREFIAAHEREEARLNTLLATMEHNALEMRTSLKQKDEHITGLESAKTALENWLHDANNQKVSLQRDLAQKDKELQFTTTVLQSIQNSKSWRYTAWFRWLVSAGKSSPSSTKGASARAPRTSGSLKGFLRGPMQVGVSAPLGKEPVRYDWRADPPTWNTLSVRLGTHGQPANGQLRLRILNPQGVEVRTAVLALAGLRDNSHGFYTFQPLPGGGLTYSLEFKLEDPSGATKLSLYELDNRRKSLKLIDKLRGKNGKWLHADYGTSATSVAPSASAAPAYSAQAAASQSADSSAELFVAPSIASTAGLPMPTIVPAAGRADLVLLLPAIRSISFSGGPNTAFILCALLARRGLRVNLVSLNIPLESEEVVQRHVASLVDDDSVLANMRFSCGQKNNPPMTLGTNDMMMATAWWTAVRAQQLLPATKRKKFFYLMQDYEPLFYGWSPEQAVAAETYAGPIIPIINEKLLADYFIASKTGNFARPEFKDEVMAFQPAVDRSRFRPMGERPGKKQILFYARPSAPRNLYYMGMEAMQSLVMRGVISPDQWEIRLMGDSIPPTNLGNGMIVRSLPWMDFNGYAENMRQATVGLSLMLSPHTSYPPLEMAASGVKVVTTVFGNKDAEGLQALSRNIIPSEPSVHSIAKGLERAIKESADRAACLAASDIALPGTWEEAFAPVLDRVIRQIEKGIETPVNRKIFLPTNTQGMAKVDTADYPHWRRARQVARQESYPTETVEPLFSIHTTVYDTPAHLLFELQKTLSAQDYPHFEWNILDNGSTKPDVIEAIQELGRMDPRFRVWRVEQNLHIIGGNRFLLQHARNPYVIPVDADDLLAPDALRILAFFIEKNKRPGLLYSDEEKTDVEGHPHEAILRHAPSILTSFSHCFYSHLACFDRQLAWDSGAYTEEYARGSHDWDTWFRLHEKGASAVHVPEILYGWRMSPESTAANSGNKDYILSSQRGVLENALVRRGLRQRFEILPDPLMGVCYWTWDRLPKQPSNVDVFFHAHSDAATATRAFTHLKATLQGFPAANVTLNVVNRLPNWKPDCEDSKIRVVTIEAQGRSENEALNAAMMKSSEDIVVVVDDSVAPEHPDWLWRVIGMFELDPKLSILSGMVLGALGTDGGVGSVTKWEGVEVPEGPAVCTVRIGGLDGTLGMPLLGETVPGIYHQGRRSLIDGNCSFVAMPWAAFKRPVFQELGGFRFDFSGKKPGSVDICARAKRAGYSCGYAGRIAFRSLVAAPDFKLDLNDAETQRVLSDVQPLLRDDPYYHPFKSLDSKRFYKMGTGEERQEMLARHLAIPEQARLPLRADHAQTARYDLSARGVNLRITNTEVDAFSERSALPVNKSEFMLSRMRDRRTRYAVKPQTGLLSLVTSAYNTPVQYLTVLAQSVLCQDYPDFEWVLVDNGSTDPETKWMLNRLAGVKNVKFIRLETNQQILGGMRCGLEHATGRYILPLDSDDFLYPDALRIMAWHIENKGNPPLLFSDEDLLTDEAFIPPYLKPGWDPVLFLNSCYIAHLGAIDRKLALEYGLYTDLEVQGSHDWHSFTTCWLKGHEPVHVPEVLYSWRVHAGSCAGDMASKPYIYNSQKRVLGLFLNSLPIKNRYQLELSPLFKGMPDWYFKRNHEAPRPIHTVVLAANPKALDLQIYKKLSGYSDHRVSAVSIESGLNELTAIVNAEAERDGIIHLVHADVSTEGQDWTWNIQAVFELYPDTALVAGRVYSPDKKVLAAAGYFRADGMYECPDAGRDESDSGYQGQLWKQISVEAPTSMCMASDAKFLAAFLKQAPAEMSLSFLGAWAGLYARAQKKRTVYTPFLCGRSISRQDMLARVNAKEQALFAARVKHETGGASDDGGPLEVRLALENARRFVPKTFPVVPPDSEENTRAPQDYPAWLDREMKTRSRHYPMASGTVRFSVITPVHDKCPAEFFRDLGEGLLRQTYQDFEWVVIVNGLVPDGLEKVIADLERDSRFRFFRWPENRGIMSAMKFCLDQARGEYVIPCDSDDLLTPDALQILASVILEKNRPQIVYSDEDHLFDGIPSTPYIRPDWDPILNVSGSYIWHLIAFQREQALKLGVFADPKACWCADWDITTQFASAGNVPIHVPEILYHWRRHSQSSTNRPDPESGSLASQKHILQRLINRLAHPELYEVELFPIFRGSPEWSIKRKRVSPKTVTTIIWENERNRNWLKNAVSGIATELVVVCDPALKVDQDGLWEAYKLFEMHSDLGLISGKIVGEDGMVIAGGELFAENSATYSPVSGKPESDAGPFALSLKPRSVSAVHPAFFIASPKALLGILNAVPEATSFAALGAWIGAAAADQNVRVGYSPLIRAVGDLNPAQCAMTASEVSEFCRANASRLPDRRWMSVFVPFYDRARPFGLQCGASK